jgi:UDP-glucose 4-epimerase
MKIFITGIAGFLGSHLADRLLELGHEVYGNDNLVGGDLKNVNPRATFYNVDCNNLDEMTKIMEGMDVVYHCACTAYEGLSVFSPSYVCQNTFQISVNTITAAVRNKVKKFIYCSSMARYGNQDKVPFTEDMIPKPQDPYGISKLAGEEVLKVLSEVHGMDYVILVPHNIIGPRQKYDDVYRNVASIMINRMLQGKQPIIYGDGEQMRCFSFVDDVVDCLVNAMLKQEAVGRVINIGPDEEFITINELANIIGLIMGFNVNPIYMTNRPKEVKHATCSADLARQLLDYSTKTSLFDGLEGMIILLRVKGAKPFAYHMPIEIINDKTPKTWTERLM